MKTWDSVGQCGLLNSVDRVLALSPHQHVSKRCKERKMTGRVAQNKGTTKWPPDQQDPPGGLVSLLLNDSNTWQQVSRRS